MNPIDLIGLNYEKMTKNERKIADLIISNPKQFIRNDFIDILNHLQVSKAAMVRFCKKLGFSGYNEYLYELRRFIMAGDHQSHQEDIIHTISSAYIQGIHDLENYLDIAQLQTLVKSILNSRKIWTFGINRSAMSAQQLSLRALSMNIDIQAVTNDTGYMRDIVRIAQPDDLIIIFTITDNTQFYSQINQLISQKNVSYVIITFNGKLNIIENSKQSIILPSSFKTYGTFYDEQALFFIFIEMLVHELVAHKNK